MKQCFVYSKLFHQSIGPLFNRSHDSHQAHAFLVLQTMRDAGLIVDIIAGEAIIKNSVQSSWNLTEFLRETLGNISKAPLASNAYKRYTV